MDKKTQDMLKQVYNHGWAHALEEVGKVLQDIRYREKLDTVFEHKTYDQIKNILDALFSELAEEIKSIATDTKNK
jgi:hypothetical protein